jgi:CRP-like cAMP-binding protein
MDVVTYIKSFPVRQFSKDEVLMSGGDDSSTVYAIREGFVKVTSLDDSGRQKLLWIAGRYDVVPLEGLFGSKPVNYFYTAFSDCSVFVIPKKTVLEAARNEPAILDQIAQGLSEHYDDMLQRMNAVEQSDVRSKLLHMLYNLCQKFSSAESVALHELGLKLTHQDLADMIGSTREVVSLELSKLREEDIIEYSRSNFTIHTKQIEPLVS